MATRKPVLTTPLSVSFTVEERLLVRQAAFDSAMSVSAFIRQATVRAAERTAKKSPALKATG